VVHNVTLPGQRSRSARAVRPTGGAAAPIEWTTRAMTAFWSANRWDDFILWSGGTKAATVTRTITLPASLVVSDYDEAYLIGAYWKNPYLSLNFLPQFRVFPAASEEWALLVRKLPDVTYFQAGLNNFQYGHVSGFGEFVEKPGPLMILKQATRIIDKTPPAITEQTPPAFANEVDPATAVVIKIAERRATRREGNPERRPPAAASARRRSSSSTRARTPSLPTRCWRRCVPITSSRRRR
jgi:hypothetical protein